MRIRRTLAVLVAAVAFASGGPLRADDEEVERRIKSAGIDEEMAGRIASAIARGRDFLKKRQGSDGSFFERWYKDRGIAVDNSGDAGLTLLCGLALRHAGLAGDAQPVKSALEWALARPAEEAGSPDQAVYSASLALMLLLSVPGYDDRAQELALELVTGMDPATGYWTYANHAAGVKEDLKERWPNLSTSQFATLGLRAARRMGAPVKSEVWSQHAKAVVAEQMPTGSWRYARASSMQRLSVGPTKEVAYATGRFMAFANLLLARGALAAGSKEFSERSGIDGALASAKRGFAKDAADFLDDPTDLIVEERLPNGKMTTWKRFNGAEPVMPGWGAYYTLFCLEKACIFGDMETLEAPPKADDPPPKKPRIFRWYVRGAEWLLKVQEKDGGWSPTAGEPVSPSSETETALAMLFLLRSPSLFHPTTPSDIGVRKLGPTTTGDPPPPMEK